MVGQVRVGRILYGKEGRVYPQFEQFSPIIVLTKTSEYGFLSPYDLKNEKGQLMHNIVEFSKVYEKLPRSVIPYTKKYRVIVWRWDEDTHLVDDQIMPNYWKWREAGLKNDRAIKCPVGIESIGKHKFTLVGEERLNNIEARSKLYVPLYFELVKNQPQFHALRERFNNGENLLIIEVNGPHEEDLPYYKQRYGVDNNFIVNDTMLATPENIKIMLNDPLQPFGHGYCLAMALQDMQVEKM
jgi:hypothetical protein